MTKKEISYLQEEKISEIKHMGHRIELEEIERSMTALDGVEKSCCVFDMEKKSYYGIFILERKQPQMSENR